MADKKPQKTTVRILNYYFRIQTVSYLAKIFWNYFVIFDKKRLR